MEIYDKKLFEEYGQVLFLFGRGSSQDQEFLAAHTQPREAYEMLLVTGYIYDQFEEFMLEEERDDFWRKGESGKDGGALVP